MNSGTTNVLTAFTNAAEKWLEANRSDNGVINTNVLNVGLITSRMIMLGLPIPQKRLLTEKKSQVRGLSGSAIATILADHDELRTFTREGGRTSRGTLQLAISLNKQLDLCASHFSAQELNSNSAAISFELESFFVNAVRREYFDKQRLKVSLDPAKPVAVAIASILDAAASRADQPTGTVLQHLVGAKLQIRFPDVEIGMDHANSADTQTKRQGDFEIGNTAFHVTVAPMEKLIQRCIENREDGYRSIILTRENRVIAARQMIDNVGMSTEISVQSAENFVGTNIEEVSQYSTKTIENKLATLVRTYNLRIDQIEVDHSLKVEEPLWITQLLSEN